MTKRWTDPFPISFFCTLFTLCVLFPATHSASSQTTNSPPFADVALPDVLQWTASAFASPLSPLPGRNGEVLTCNMWPASRPPFSFVYDGKSSETFFTSWKREIQNRELADRTELATRYNGSIRKPASRRSEEHT